MTNQYNQALRQSLPNRGVEIREIPRLEIGGKAVSASEVRRLLEKGDTEAIEDLVPHTTFSFLKTNALL